MCDLPEDVRWFLGCVVAFAEARDDVRAVALVGSHARDMARRDSDVDVVMLTTEPDKYVLESEWIEQLRGAALLATRRWGALTERRLVLASARQVDFGVARPSWASNRPLDPGTARVARDGLVALYDPDGLLAGVVAAATESRMTIGRLLVSPSGAAADAVRPRPSGQPGKRACYRLPSRRNPECRRHGRCRQPPA